MVYIRSCCLCITFGFWIVRVVFKIVITDTRPLSQFGLSGFWYSGLCRNGYFRKYPKNCLHVIYSIFIIFGCECNFLWLIWDCECSGTYAYIKNDLYVYQVSSGSGFRLAILKGSIILYATILYATIFCNHSFNFQSFKVKY